MRIFAKCEKLLGKGSVARNLLRVRVRLPSLFAPNYLEHTSDNEKMAFVNYLLGAFLE